MSESLADLRQAILDLEEGAALTTTEALLARGVAPQEILEEGLTGALMELGDRWQRGEAFLPEVIAAAAIFEKCNELVEPRLLAGAEHRSGDRFVLATVKGDLHDLGKNIVGAMLKTVGMEVHDLGKNVPSERIVEAVRELSPSFVGLSALLTTTMPEQERTIQALAEAGLRSRVKVMVGGAPVTQEWADRIGADGYAANGPDAIRVALELRDRAGNPATTSGDGDKC